MIGKRGTKVKYIIIYLICVNVAAFCMYGIDKYKATHGKWRISEATLIMSAVIGGSIGAYLGMKTFHHKTLKKKFSIAVPAIFILQVAVAVAIIILGGK